MQATLIRQAITVTPITKSQPVKGSNKTSKIPKPNPIRQTAIVFLNSLNIIYYLLSFVYYIKYIFYLLLLYGYLLELQIFFS